MKLINIGASWCMSCIIMKSRFEKAQSLIGDDVEIIELDVDKDKAEIEKYNIGEKLPVYIIMNEDKEVSRIIGEKGSKDLENFFREGGVING